MDESGVEAPLFIIAKRRIPEQGSLDRSEEYKPSTAQRGCLYSETEGKRPGREGTEA